MIKFERLSKDAKVTIVRGEVAQPVYLGMTVSAQELETLKVISGKVLYTIDEEKIVEVYAEQKLEAPVSTIATEPTPVEEVQEPKKPAIVKPAPRTAKK